MEKKGRQTSPFACLLLIFCSIAREQAGDDRFRAWVDSAEERFIELLTH